MLSAVFFNGKNGKRKEQGFLLPYVHMIKYATEDHNLCKDKYLLKYTYIFHLSLVVAVQHQPKVNMGKMCPLKGENSKLIILMKKTYI